MNTTLRPLRRRDDDEIRQTFRETLVLGRPVPFPLPEFAAYEALALDWYLTEGRDNCAVVEANERHIGYALVCTRETDFRRWQRAAVARYLRRILPRLATGQISGEARRFYWLRIVDGFLAWRDSPSPDFGAHAHFNVRAGARGGLVIRDLLEHIDRCCRSQRISDWYGEINAPAGRRARVIERYGMTILHRQDNTTLAWLVGAPVERLTVRRRVGPIQRIDRLNCTTVLAG